jgi:hypothetical protein
MNEKPHLELIRLLVARLERISVDSYWAHRASGVRGALINLQYDTQADNSSKEDTLITLGFQILEKAAAEVEQKARFKR